MLGSIEETTRYSEYLHKGDNYRKASEHIQAAIVAGDIDYVRKLENTYGLIEEDLLAYVAHGGHLFLLEKLVIL